MRLRRVLIPLVWLAVAGCKKEPPPQPPAPAQKDVASGSSVSTLLNSDQAPPPPTAAAAPPAPTADTTAAPVGGTPGDPPGSQFSLPHEARMKRNREWLKILKGGTPQQQQQVQDQMTKLSSDELHELTVMFYQQK